MASKETKHSIAVVGGGLVGSLNTCFLAKRGFEVHLYEYREDIRTLEHVQGKSINLALAERGRHALRKLGIEPRLISTGIPMYSRMIHDLDGKTRVIPYGQQHQYNLSMDRRKLNEDLLTQAESFPNVHLYFGYKLVSCDFETNNMTFERPDGTTESASADFIIGCDGAHSTLRSQMMKRAMFNYSQEYIPHAYKEICLRPLNGQFAMEVNHLHIWPRSKFMLIALPNQDKTFTCTVFMPWDNFSVIKSEEECIQFFNEMFPDFIKLMGEKNLLLDYFQLPPQPLISVKCYPYHIGSSAVIMGDAAHAMVPFHGQGMNCGFEDCLVFDNILETTGNNFEKAIVEFTQMRNKDAAAICDLSMRNYLEMRDHVNHVSYLLRKKLDNLLHFVCKNKWIPLYSMVMYTNIPYHKCVEYREWQDKVLDRSNTVLKVAMVTGGGILLWKNWSNIMNFIDDFAYKIKH
ncbi:PREDICTED: kynurenine 3-monooxygenase-like [Priapulus caudatus]|uniref:Kynurenine 3-monooxygenase n=1 Tax=Priapulus caudatus TaxID=37621 RepID=A0ABM1DTF5_PRICU|nr:PREDICTED: kynurenine 3-monooxygenase-like [Priapulus caudatus]